MSQIFDKDGKVIPVTVIEAGPCFITQIKNTEKDGYVSVQLGFEELKKNKIKRPQKDRPYRYIKEFKIESNDKCELKKGDKVDVSIFAEGDKVKISGISKGRGFQGVVKRHGFKGGPASHGHKHSLRKPGSIGSSFPERVPKGKRMAGHMGVARITVKNLRVASTDIDNNLVAISGAIPGPIGGLVEIKKI